MSENTDKLISELIVAAREFALNVSLGAAKREKDAGDALRASLAASQAEVERLRGIIRKVEWDFKIGEYDAYHDVTTTDKYECLHCGFIFFSEMTRSHAESCPFCQWEAQ